MPFPDIVYDVVIVMMIVGAAYWTFYRRKFLKQMKLDEPENWEHFKPYRIPFRAFSDFKLEKFVAKNRHREFSSQELVHLGNRLKIAQRMQITIAAIAIITLFGPLIYSAFGQIGQ